MTVQELTDYLAKHTQPHWKVVIVSPYGDFEVAYADRSGREQIGIVVPQATPFKP